MNNLTIFQFFHWYYSPEGNLWNYAKEEAARLTTLGITHVWLPPAYKSAKGMDEPGYAVYDLYDLGEFEQKGSVRTRYGTREEYISAIECFHQNKIQVLADIVLNHKLGGDEIEEIPVQTVKEDNRLEFVSEVHNARGHTRFIFPGRNKKYSDYIWDWHSFTGFSENGLINFIHNEYTNGRWEDVMSNENGNYDYLMGCDVEFRNPYVRDELNKWGEWYIETTGIDGFRFDAVKHIAPGFFPEWVNHLKKRFNKDFFCVGEYWKSEVHLLLQYIEATNGAIQLFDVPLHFNFYEASVQGNNFDLRKIFDNSLVQNRPELAVTFVDNHDTQPLQGLESPVEFWFKPIAYALILLREQGVPCIFYPHIYEAKYTEDKNGEKIFVELNKVDVLEKLLMARKNYAYGKQIDYFDHPNVVGWIREGISEKPDSGCAVLVSNSEEGFKTMSMGPTHAGKVFIDLCGCRNEKIELNERGEAVFLVNPGSVSVWVVEKTKSQQ